jgi:hypothetical protein
MERKIRATYEGKMTPEIRAYLNELERVMNANVDVDRLVAASEQAALEASTFGTSKPINPADFIRPSARGPAPSTPTPSSD